MKFYNIGGMTTAVNKKEKSNEEHKKKLSKVLSTKLSIEDYKLFRVLTNHAYRNGAIHQDSPSEMLRYIMTPVIDGFRRLPVFSLL
jgi:hypothetical protein